MAPRTWHLDCLVATVLSVALLLRGGPTALGEDALTTAMPMEALTSSPLAAYRTLSQWYSKACRAINCKPSPDGDLLLATSRTPFAPLVLTIYKENACHFAFDVERGYLCEARSEECDARAPIPILEKKQATQAAREVLRRLGIRHGPVLVVLAPGVPSCTGESWGVNFEQERRDGVRFAEGGPCMRLSARTGKVVWLRNEILAAPRGKYAVRLSLAEASKIAFGLVRQKCSDPGLSPRVKKHEEWIIRQERGEEPVPGNTRFAWFLLVEVDTAKGAKPFAVVVDCFARKARLLK